MLNSSVREVRDHLGRRYRIGDQPHDLMGRPRSSMRWLCWLPMLLVGVQQYGFGAAVPALSAGRHQSIVELLWLLAIWTVFQAAAGFPVAYLRERGRVGPRPVMLAGALLCLAGPLALAHGPAWPVMLAGYSALGGTGAGLVYAACTSTLAKWYPENAGRVSFATGAYAYGSVPFVVALILGGTPSTLRAMLDGFAILLFLAVLGCGLLFADPPRYWWPAHLDPRHWALSRTGQRKNPPAVRQFSAREALRTRALTVMYTCLFCASSVSLCNAAFLVLLAGRIGITAWATAGCAAVFVATNGTGRALSTWVSDLIGRRRTLCWVLGVQAVGQFLLFGAAAQNSGPMFVEGTVLAGIGGGAFYPLFASLVRDYFGEQSTAEVHGVVYSAKAFSGLVGVGLAALAVGPWGYPPLFLGAACLSVGAALLSRTLRRPGFPSTLPAPHTDTALRRSSLTYAARV